MKAWWPVGYSWPWAWLGSGSLLERDVRDKTIYAKNVLVIVHSNGVHHLLVQWCRCPGHIPDDIQALNLHFFPASFKQVKILFTFEGLDSFLAENQECKSLAWHYYQKLRRFTSTCFSEMVLVSIHATHLILIIPTLIFIELSRTDIGNFSDVPGNSKTSSIWSGMGLGIPVKVQALGILLSLVLPAHRLGSIYLKIGRMMMKSKHYYH